MVIFASWMYSASTILPGCCLTGQAVTSRAVRVKLQYHMLKNTNAVLCPGHKALARTPHSHAVPHRRPCALARAPCVGALLRAGCSAVAAGLRRRGSSRAFRCRTQQPAVCHTPAATLTALPQQAAQHRCACTLAASCWTYITDTSTGARSAGWRGVPL